MVFDTNTRYPTRPDPKYFFNTRTRPEVEKPYPSDPDYIILIVPHQAIAALSPSGIETRVAHIDDNLVIISQIDNIFFDNLTEVCCHLN